MTETKNLDYDFSKAPRHENGYRRYVMDGIPPGDFMYNLLADNLYETVFRADPINKQLLEDHARFIYNELPSQCWGDEETVNNWIDQGGIDDT